MTKLISKFFINENLPAKKIASYHFKNLILGCQQAGTSVELPTPYEIKIKYLDLEYDEIKEYVNSMREKWETYGCTIMCDG